MQRHGLDRGVIGLFSSGASLPTGPPRIRTAQLLTYPESRLAPKWANVRIFHGSIIHCPKARPVFFAADLDSF